MICHNVVLVATDFTERTHPIFMFLSGIFRAALSGRTSFRATRRKGEKHYK